MVDPFKGARTDKGHRRRALILKVASELFSESGYDSVSLNDIGHAAGITGPAIYRYFDGKEDILASIYEHLYSRHADGESAVTASGASRREMLIGLVDLQVELATQEPEKIRIISNEERHLPDQLAAVLRSRRQQTMRVWIDLLQAERPDLTIEQVEVTFHGVLAMVNSICLRRGEEPAPQRAIDQLRSVALHALFAPDWGSKSPLSSQ